MDSWWALAFFLRSCLKGFGWGSCFFHTGAWRVCGGSMGGSCVLFVFVMGSCFFVYAFEVFFGGRLLSAQDFEGFSVGLLPFTLVFQKGFGGFLVSLAETWRGKQ